MQDRKQLQELRCKTQVGKVNYYMKASKKQTKLIFERMA